MSTETRTQNPKARKTTRRLYFMAALIETEEEITQPESTPPSPGVEYSAAFTDERPSRPGIRKAALAAVIPGPFRKVAASR